MGRDRDPFDRALEALRQRVSQSILPQGAALPVNALAAELGVSSTPVREALARLAGEGLVIRTSSGYATLTWDRGDLAALYGLAGLLAEAVLATLVLEPDQPPPTLDEALRGGGSVTREEYARVEAQLAPFGAAEREVLGQDDRMALERAIAERQPARTLGAMTRRYYRRRARRAGDILRRALGVG